MGVERRFRIHFEADDRLLTEERTLDELCDDLSTRRPAYASRFSFKPTASLLAAFYPGELV